MSRKHKHGHRLPSGLSARDVRPEELRGIVSKAEGALTAEESGKLKAAIELIVLSLLERAGLPAHRDAERGFDHGTYAILAVTHPAADVPTFQVSIRADYDPQAHLQLGRALAPLRDEGVLITGSGSSYHNLRPSSSLAARGPTRRNLMPGCAIR